MKELKFATYKERFVKNLEQNGKSQNTIKNYKVDLDCFALYLSLEQKNENIANFSTNHAKDYGKFLQEKYTSNNSIRRRIQTLRLFFDFLLRENIVQQNPLLSLPVAKKFLDIPRPCSLLDVKTLWTTLLIEERDNKDLLELIAVRNQILVLLIFGAGLKVSDISELKRDDFILSSNPRVTITPPKIRPYSIPLPSLFTIIAKKYLTLLDKEQLRSKLNFTHLLFNANAHTIMAPKLSARGMEIIFKDYSKKIDSPITPKSLRQACIFKWIYQGHPETTIKEWLGTAPSYDLKLYREHASMHQYNDNFLQGLYDHYIIHR